MYWIKINSFFKSL